MKITKSQLRQIIKEEIDKELRPDIEKAIIDTLEVEGGAAGLKPLVDSAKEVAKKKKLTVTKQDIIDLLKKMKKVKEHEHGDYYISEGMKHHVDNKLPITESIYRLGSDAYFSLIKEAKKLNKEGRYQFSDEEQEFINENPDLGEWAWHEEEGQDVPLDFPMYIEASPALYEEKKKKGPLNKPMKNTDGGKKYKVYVKDPKTGNIRTITYGDSKGGLKGNWNNAEARKSFAARHNCADKAKKSNRKLTAGYWACRAHKDFGKNVPGRFW
jgi:hypothetical protein